MFFYGFEGSLFCSPKAVCLKYSKTVLFSNNKNPSEYILKFYLFLPSVSLYPFAAQETFVLPNILWNHRIL